MNIYWLLARTKCTERASIVNSKVGLNSIDRRALTHSQTRFQFDRPLVSFGLVQEKIVRMGALVQAMDASTYLTAGILNHGEDDFMLEAAILKVFTSEALWEILYDTMQILGGRSFFCNQPFERIMRDARLNMIGEGSNEVLRAFIGGVGIRDVGMRLKSVSEAIRSPFSGFGMLFGFGKKSLHQVLTLPMVLVQSEQISEEAGKLGNRIKRLGIMVPRVLAKYGECIIEKQLTLDRFAEVGIALYTAAAVLSRIDSRVQNKNRNTDQIQKELLLSKAYCRMAFQRFDNAFKGFLSNGDQLIESTSDRITGWK